MGVPKGTDNFKAYRAGRSSASLALIATELQKVRKKRFATVDDLVRYLEPRVRIHRTNLKRNEAYFAAIFKFWKAQPGASKLALDAMPPDVRGLAHQLTDAQLALGQRQEELDDAKSAMHRLTTTPKDGDERVTSFADTVWALRSVLDRINAYGEVMFVVDFARGEIRDVSASPGRQTVVSGKRLEPFLSAYKRLLKQEGVDER